ncbi:DUF2437 domain-containing protein [Candidatus Poribacteria bacterium]|nr:DUF2437 domain-containing protein [Candidatus Poribacteria bacterium]
MKIGRVEYRDETFYVQAIEDGARMLRIDGDIFGDYKVTDQELNCEEVRFLIPVDYSHRKQKLVQVYCFGNSFTLLRPEVAERYIREGKRDQSVNIWQRIFARPHTSLTPDGQSIPILPEDDNDLLHEPEVVLVVGKEGRDIPQGRAMEYICGITCGNDITTKRFFYWSSKGSGSAEGLAEIEASGETYYESGIIDPWKKIYDKTTHPDGMPTIVPWLGAKSLYGSIAPWMVLGEDINYENLDFDFKVNGEVRIKSNTHRLKPKTNLPEMISGLSHIVTLIPGDLIFLGTDFSTAPWPPIQVGDVLETCVYDRQKLLVKNCNQFVNP